MSKHPALQMSKQREAVWLKEAQPEDFFEMVTILSQLYAKKIYTPKSGYNGDSLLASYPAYLKGKMEREADKDYTNNVPFLSSSDAPGSVLAKPEVEETETEATLKELMDLI